MLDYNYVVLKGVNLKYLIFISCEVGDGYSIEVALRQSIFRNQSLGGSWRLQDYILVSVNSNP